MIPHPLDVFVPDGDEARRWAEQELSNPRYADAKPTWFDYLAADVADFIAGLFSPEAGRAGGGIALIVLGAVLVAALIAVLLLWGRPRSSARSRRVHGELLGERDDRTAARLRIEAERAARDGDLDRAVTLRFRALARGLIERALIDPPPGATAQAIARRAERVFPGQAMSVSQAAGVFDAVRYLGRGATADDYRLLADVDGRLAAARPEPEDARPAEAVLS